MEAETTKSFTICYLIVVLTIKTKEILQNIQQNVVILHRETNKVSTRTKRVSIN
jgi:hypothetical protein